MIARIEAFKTRDGKVWERQLDAVEHERDLDLREKLDTWVGNYCYSGMDRTDIFNLLLEYGHELPFGNDEG